MEISRNRLCLKTSVDKIGRNKDKKDIETTYLIFIAKEIVTAIAKKLLCNTVCTRKTHSQSLTMDRTLLRSVPTERLRL